MKRPMFFFEGETAGGAGGGATSQTLLGGDGGAAAAASAVNGAAAPAAGSWSWAKEDGTFSEGWLDKMPDGLKDNASLRSVGTLHDLAKSYVETKAMIGKKLEMPGDGATPEAVAAWRKTVGAPETPAGYLGEAKTLRPDSIPEGLWDTAGEKKFLELAHKHSLPPAAVKDILKFHGDNVAGALQNSQVQEGEVLKAEGAKLRQAFGTDYDGNMALAARVATTVGLDPKTHPIFTSAEAVQAFAKLGKLLSEDKLVRGDATGISGSIKDRVRDITDPSGTSALAREYRGEFGPDRQAAAQRQLHELMAAAEQK